MKNVRRLHRLLMSARLAGILGAGSAALWPVQGLSQVDPVGEIAPWPEAVQGPGSPDLESRPAAESTAPDFLAGQEPPSPGTDPPPETANTPERPQELPDRPSDAGAFLPISSDPSDQALPGRLLDSLARCLGRLEITRALEEVSSAALWRRLLPRIQIGGTIGARELAFPDIGGVHLLPKDSYRISVSIPLTEVLDGSRGERALLALEGARLRYALLCEQQAEARCRRQARRESLHREITWMRERLLIAQSLLEYHQVLFRQGKADFEVLQRSRIALLQLRGSIERLVDQRDAIP